MPSLERKNPNTPNPTSCDLNQPTPGCCVAKLRVGNPLQEVRSGQHCHRRAHFFVRCTSSEESCFISMLVWNNLNPDTWACMEQRQSVQAARRECPNPAGEERSTRYMQALLQRLSSAHCQIMQSLNAAGQAGATSARLHAIQTLPLSGKFLQCRGKLLSISQ